MSYTNNTGFGKNIMRVLSRKLKKGFSLTEMHSFIAACHLRETRQTI